jgi:hypothetical protein
LNIRWVFIKNSYSSEARATSGGGDDDDGYNNKPLK